MPHLVNEVMKCLSRKRLPLTGRAGVDSSTKSPGPVFWQV